MQKGSYRKLTARITRQEELRDLEARVMHEMVEELQQMAHEELMALRCPVHGSSPEISRQDGYELTGEGRVQGQGQCLTCCENLERMVRWKLASHRLDRFMIDAHWVFVDLEDAKDVTVKYRLMDPGAAVGQAADAGAARLN